MNAQDIVDRLIVQLKDPNSTRWPLVDLIDYISDGQRQLCVLKPDAFTRIEIIKLNEGSLQTVPFDSHRFQKGIDNMGTDGLTVGDSITEANIDDMDRFNPGWKAATPGAAIEEWLFDYDNPEQFWVYPPVPGTDLYIRIQSAKIPSDVTTLNDPLNVKDLYLPALYEYGMYRALTKNDDLSNKAEGELHRQRFYNAIGLKIQADKEQRTRTKEKVE